MEAHTLILQAIADLKRDQNRRIDELKRDQNRRLDRIDQRLETLNNRVRDTEREITKIKTMWSTGAALVGGAMSYLAQKVGW